MRARIFVITVLFLLFSTSTSNNGGGVNALWPAPRTTYTTGNVSLRLASSFEIVPAQGFTPPADLVDAIARAQKALFEDTLAPLTPDRGKTLGKSEAVTGAAALTGLQLTLGASSPSSIAVEATRPVDERDEGYVLSVPADGSAATLSANSTLGLFRGLMTFGQLWYQVDEEVFATGFPLEIVDSPAFPYRGFMLDTARNFFPISDIKRTLDAMSWVKLNTFHWHIVDSQSFPLQIPGFEALSEAAAYDSASVYSPEDVTGIVQYANERGIDVLLEIDTPGHTSAIGRAFPEHIACFEATPWATYAAEPPAGQLRLTEPATVNFTASLLAATAQMVPSAGMMSTGGDEVNTACYGIDNQTMAALNATGEDIQTALNGALDTFTQKIHEVVRTAGKTPVVWEEMVLNFNLTLGNDTIVLVWISSADAEAVAAKGFRFIHAASDFFYLDCGAGGWVGSFPSGNSWCDPFKTWQKSYSFDPFANLTTADTQALVLGGEALLWTEQSSASNLDPIVWPRAASVAEVFWTGETRAGGEKRDGGEALPRLHDLAYRMLRRGVHAIPLQPKWCALRPGVCDLTA